MKVCSNYFKILIAILLISVIFYLSNKIKERFLVVGNKCNVNKDCDKAPKSIKLMVNTNNSKNKIKLSWRKQETDENTKYLIIMYKNNQGPYIIKPTEPNGDEYSYEFLNPVMNLRYKFAVIGTNDYGLGKVNKFTEALLNEDGLELKYLQDISSKVVCNADGSYKISDKCIVNEEVNAEIIDKDTKSNFNHEVHEQLIKDLEDKLVLKFNL